MEPISALDQLAMCCCLNRRSQRAGFDRAFHQQQRNYYYSPSMAQMNAFGSVGTWPIGASLAPQAQALNPSPFLQPQHQPYFLVTQPVIIANAQPQQANTVSTNLDGSTSASQQQQLSMAGQLQRATIPSQYAIYSAAANAKQQSNTGTIYENPRQVQQNLAVVLTNASQRGHYGGHAQQLSSVQRNMLADGINIAQQEQQVSTQRRKRALNSEIFKRLESIEKQVDLSREMDLVEQHSIVITRAIDPYTLMPQLTADILRHYQTRYLFSDDYVIRFIEIIKRPGQTLGLYIRGVQFDGGDGRMREGVIITKIESDSPIYTSQVLHVGDEILSVNLIDVHGMSLDDVVIIMSIPKRLVLALRIPKERDLSQTRDSQVQHGTLGRKFTPVPQARLPTSSSVIGMGLSPRHRPPMLGALADLRPSTIMGQVSRVPVGEESINRGGQMSFSRPHSRLNYHQQSDESDSGIQSARPVRVQSVMHMNEILNEQKAELDELDAKISLKAMRQAMMGSHQQQQQQQQQRQQVLEESISRASDSSRLYLDQRQMIDSNSNLANQIEQVTTSLSSPPGPMKPVQLGETARSYVQQNFSLDQELANLEREAMNRDRHIAIVSDSYQDDRLERGQSIHATPLTRFATNDSDANAGELDLGLDRAPSSSVSSTSKNGSSIRHLPTTGYNEIPVNDIFSSTSRQSYTSTTLPSISRRILPTLPDEHFRDSPTISSPQQNPHQNQVGSVSNPSTMARRPIINNIRLGTTNEQSSYFSSSIDAINRELKDLRRQRMALDGDGIDTMNDNKNSGDLVLDDDHNPIPSESINVFGVGTPTSVSRKEL